MAISTSLFPFPQTPKLRNPPLPLYATTTSLSTRRFDLLSSSSSTHILKVSTVFDTVTVGEDFPVNYGEWFPESDPDIRRRAGVLLHPTSFRGPYGIGDLGDQAFRFVDWLHEAGFSVWQVLPLVPPGRKANEEGSPYSGQVMTYLVKQSFNSPFFPSPLLYLLFLLSFQCLRWGMGRSD